MRRARWTATALAAALLLGGQAAMADDGDAGSTGEGSGTTATTTPSPAADTTSPATTSASTNQSPIPVADSATVTAGKTVIVDVLANDTDDGLGRPEGETPHLEVVGTSGGGDRVSFDADSVTFRARDDERGEVTVGYTVSDGELQAQSTITVTVKAPPRRTVTIAVPKDLVALKSFRIHGRTAPTAPRATSVRVQRLEHGRWSTYKVDRRVDALGRYSVRLTTNRLGRHTFRAIGDWRNDKHARSGRVIRSVRGVADVRVSGPLPRKAVRYSWRSGCPVPPNGLRKIAVNRIDYHHRVSRGTIVVRATVVPDIAKLLRSTFNARFPIKTLKPAEAFYAGGRRTPTQSDVAAMRAGNTSAFNCRPVTGNPYRISQHSYGNAIDINTIQNPYVVGSRVYPSFAREYLDRSPYRKGMILPGGVVAATMNRLGWPWGARWAHPDYQHFSSNGG
jgi:hypothetical protein